MAQVLVRDIDESVHDRLLLRAERHGRSLEEELRDILRAAAEEAGADPEEGVGLGTQIASRFRGRGLDFDVVEMRGGKLQVPDFE